MNPSKMNVGPNNFRPSPSGFENSGTQQIGGINIPIASSGAPPIPPRRSVNSYQTYNTYSPYSTPYLSTGSYGYGSTYNRFGGLGTYGPYGGCGLGYSQNQWGGGPSGDVENRFVQYAEESTRPAFQSIEAMVHTFSSMTMMLESTFFAMTSSFRAILGVAENMGKLRSMLRHFISTFALFRFFKWLYWRVKYLMGVKPEEPSEKLWQQTISEVFKGNDQQTSPTSWPIFVFLGFLFATPYLIHRLVRNAQNIDIDAKNPKDWIKCPETVFSATALYDFVPATAEELPLKSGQKVFLAPQSLQPKSLPGWSRVTDGTNVGLVPTTYIEVIGRLVKKPDVQNSSIATALPNDIPSNTNQLESDSKCKVDDQNDFFQLNN